MNWLQFVTVFGTALQCLSAISFQSECNVPLSKNDSLSEKLKFLQSYKVSGVITNWMSKNVASVLELSKSDRVSTLISDRETTLHWISIGPDQKFLHNQTSGKCGTATTSPLAAYTPLSAISKDLSSLSTLVAGLVEFSKTSQGEFRGNRVVAGVEGVHWVACVNGTNETANLQVEVIFAGDSSESLKPPSPHFNNPTMLFLQVAELGKFSDNSTLKSLLSLEFDGYSDATPEDEHWFGTPPGTICEGWKETKIPLNASDPFSAIVQHIDEKKSVSESALYYSSREQLVVVSGARRSDVVPFINEKEVPKEATTVVHDFGKGYEYALDSDRCIRLSALPNNTDDVLSTSEGILSMKPIAQILLAADLKYGNYGQLTTANGRTLDIYRGVDNKTNDIVEARFDGDQLESYSIYKLVNSTPTLSSHMRFTRGLSDVMSSFTENIRNCFAMSSSSFNENSTFTFEVKSRSLKDVYIQGIETVSAALASALVQIAPINPYRVRIFYDTGVGKTLRVFFSIGEKTDVKPSAVPKYNFTGSDTAEEVASSVLLEKLNATITQGDWKFSVPTRDEKQDWIVKMQSLNRYTPPSSTPGPSYSGYTGGAMFVLGVFSLLLGVAIGAGSVFFVTRRQRISTLAYQVFE
ncbi:hypothetical protein RB195_007720 [Necator americanus]|uniref:Uncharacterized protein n=1 Tax=Necator americanus TaxID=51031 RepID=A0ABR1BYL6_NECAM